MAPTSARLLEFPQLHVEIDVGKPGWGGSCQRVALVRVRHRRDHQFVLAGLSLDRLGDEFGTWQRVRDAFRVAKVARGIELDRFVLEIRQPPTGSSAVTAMICPNMRAARLVIGRSRLARFRSCKRLAVTGDPMAPVPGNAMPGKNVGRCLGCEPASAGGDQWIQIRGRDVADRRIDWQPRRRFLGRGLPRILKSRRIEVRPHGMPMHRADERRWCVVGWVHQV